MLLILNSSIVIILVKMKESVEDNEIGILIKEKNSQENKYNRKYHS